MDLKEIIKKEIDTFINESATLMTERWSISDTVENAMQDIYNAIALDLRNVSPREITKTIYAYVNDIIINVFNKSINLYYVCYNCSDEKSCNIVYRDGAKYNNFDEKNNHLTLTIYLVNGEVIEDYSNVNIIHELEHIYQIIQGRKNNPHYNKLMNSAYEYASNVIDNKDKYTLDDYIVAKLIYYSNSHEQDAFMHEYYDDLKRNPALIHLKNSYTHKVFEQYMKDIEYFRSHMNDRALSLALNNYRLYGYTKNNFNIMLEKQSKRFEKKMRNVEKHFINK
jgi:hypothetical protein